MAVQNALGEELVANPRRSDAEAAQSQVGRSIFEHIRGERVIGNLRPHIVCFPDFSRQPKYDLVSADEDPFVPGSRVGRPVDRSAVVVLRDGA